MKLLTKLIQNLESKPEVDAVFLTGSHGIDVATESSDIDLIVILDENKIGIRYVYEKIDGMFADIIFFDKSELKKLLHVKEVSGNSFDGMLISWLKKSDIKCDKSGLLAQLKANLSTLALTVPDNEKNEELQKISYNIIQNQRYFSAKDKTCHEALEIRLMYSVPQLLTGFLALRDEPWRGEKEAIKFIKEKGPGLFSTFTDYQRAVTLEEKMRLYIEMTRKILPANMKFFDYATPIALSVIKNTTEEMEKQKKFWEGIAA